MPNEDNGLQFDLEKYRPVLATAYGEAANQDWDTKVRVLSTILNRAESGKKEFGADTGRITDVLNKGYYAYSQKSPKFMEAMNNKFPDEMSKDSYRELQIILSGMLKGKVERTKDEFFLTPQESKKASWIKNLELTGKSGAWNFYRYPDTPIAGKASQSKKIAGKASTSKKKGY